MNSSGSYTKVSVSQLQDLANSIMASRKTIQANLQSYKSNISNIKGNGYMRGISEDALEIAIRSVEATVNSFSEYADKLLNNIKSVVEKATEIETAAANAEKDVYEQDPLSFTKGVTDNKNNENPTTDNPTPSETPKGGSQAAIDAANTYPNGLSKREGARYVNGHKETYYSETVLPGPGLTALNNNGRHVDQNGIIRDKDGYVAVACDDYPMGTVIETSWGKGKVYDRVGNSGIVDIYVNSNIMK